MRTALLLLALVLTPSLLVAQDQANFDLAQRFTTQAMDKMVGSLEVDPNWIEEEDRFWYEYETPEGTRWMLVDAETRTKQPLFDAEALAAELAESFSKPFNSKDLPLEEFAYDTEQERFSFHVDSIRFTYRPDTRALVRGDSVEADDEDDDWRTYSPDSTWIAFARDHNLFLMRADAADSTEYQLTTDGERWYSYQRDDGDTTSTERLEARATWFDDSQKLYVRRQDRRHVGDLWVIDHLEERPELETYKYPMPGEEDVPRDELWVFDVDDREGVEIQADKWKDQALGGVYFNEGGFFTGSGSDYLYFLRRDRTWKHIDVVKANTETGATEVLWSETSEPYFNTRYADLAVLNDGDEFLWWSERTGWGQLYRYDANGTLLNRITDGYFTVGDIVQIDTARQVVFFEGYGKEPGVNPYYAQIYRVGFDGSDQERLTPEEAHHSFSMGDPQAHFVDTYSRVDLAPRSVLRDREGRVVLELETTDLSQLETAGWQPPETFSVKAADGQTDLYGVLWRPFDFDSTKTYPIISYVYPGPQVEPFPVEFTITGSRGRPTALAQLGFVVVAFGQRGGSPVRSKYYHNYGYGNLRDYPLADNKYGLEQLGARHPWVDLDHVGIFGHSGGGFMSTAALLTHPEFYDVAVSSAGNHDNNVYNQWWSEVHHGVQEQRRISQRDSTAAADAEADSTEIYFESEIPANPDLADNLEGHLLLVHGTIDSNVHPANTLRLVDALIKAGKRFDFMMLPGQRHGFGDMTPYFERMMWHYFAEHLLGDYRPDAPFVLPDEE